MAHPFATNFLQCDFNATFFTDNAFVFHPLVLTAQAFVVLYRAKDTGTEKPVPLWLEGTIIDGLWLFDLTKRPAEDALRRCDRDANLIKTLRPLLLAEDFLKLIHSVFPLLFTFQLAEFNVEA